MIKKYDTEKIMKRVKKNRPHVLRNAVQKLQEENQAQKMVEKANKAELRAAKKEAQIHKEKLKAIEDQRLKALEKARKTKAKNRRSKQAKK